VSSRGSRPDSIRLRIYRQALGTVAKSRWAQRSLGVDRDCTALLAGTDAIRAFRGAQWYHAASAGELEILYPVLLAAGKNGAAVVVTVFSLSDPGVFNRARAEWAREGLDPSKLLLSPAPLEGNWLAPIRAVGPAVLVTAKYEAWPELWAALGAEGVPLVIVNAQERPSLRIARRICRALGAPEPRKLLLASSEAEAAPLRTFFPEDEVIVSGDPRWDRVQARSAKGNPRARSLIRWAQAMPRPWGILGSVWPEDLKALGSGLTTTKGTLWLVPHAIRGEAFERILATLRSSGVDPVRTSGVQEGDLGTHALNLSGLGARILVDEMGFLSELYGAADWAYVGGGFGKDGVHSTIEPAIQGIPVACGTSRMHRFPEIEQLASSGQLCVVRTPQELQDWVETRGSSTGGRLPRAEWLEGAKARLGAADRVSRQIQRLVLQAKSP
jgi:3-deoxy-D-manno-octulosonic-acid transferase